MSIVWKGDKQVSANMAKYGNDIHKMVEDVANQFAPQIESEAKNDAPWKDRTGETRDALFTVVQRPTADLTVIYLSHGKTKKHGKLLELRWAGKYSIVLPTLERYYSPIMTTLQDNLE